MKMLIDFIGIPWEWFLKLSLVFFSIVGTGRGLVSQERVEEEVHILNKKLKSAGAGGATGLNPLLFIGD